MLELRSEVLPGRSSELDWTTEGSELGVDAAVSAELLWPCAGLAVVAGASDVVPDETSLLKGVVSGVDEGGMIVARLLLGGGVT